MGKRCVFISGGIKELVFDLDTSHASGCLKNLPWGWEVSSSGRVFFYIK